MQQLCHLLLSEMSILYSTVELAKRRYCVVAKRRYCVVAKRRYCVVRSQETELIIFKSYKESACHPVDDDKLQAYYLRQQHIRIGVEVILTPDFCILTAVFLQVLKSVVSSTDLIFAEMRKTSQK